MGTLEIHWTTTLNIPQLDTLSEAILEIGEKLVAELGVIQDAINALTAQQAVGQADLAAHLQAIEDEIKQLDAETITQEQLDGLAAQIHETIAISAQGAETLRAATERVKGMVPDTPA